MRLKRLELQGFKSFLDRTILTFEPGVTGVVGPNGCGKSNIVDAIMWVMGEQSPKHLRGESMTDIIFNGSDSRAATSMAEVSLVMDKQGVALAPQFAAFDRGDEISVTRRIYRDGLGEFFINKVPCRLRDIHELFMDTGVGRRAYSIIEQGQIDRMINVKPEERRHLFEEVAGITKYKAKRKEAEKKLELTRQNVLRIHDIVAELEKQIRSLKIQATRARKYKEIKGELESVDLFILGQQLTIHREVISRLTVEQEAIVNERSQAEAQFAEVDAAVTEFEVLRIDQERKIQELGDRERDVLLAIQKLETQVSLLGERQKNLTKSLESLGQEAIERAESKGALVIEEQSQTAQRDDLEGQLRAADERVGQLEQSLNDAQNLKHDCLKMEKEIQRRLTQLAESELRLGHQLESAQSRVEEIAESQSLMASQVQEADRVLGGVRDALSLVEVRIADCVQRSQNAEVTTAGLSVDCQATSRELSETEDLLFQKREHLQNKRSRLESLSELQNNLEGYSSTAKEIFTELQTLGLHVTPFAELIQPDAELEDHMELLLGESMNLLVVPTRAESESLVRTIEERDLERVSVTSKDWDDGGGPQEGIEGAVPILSRIKVKEGYEAIAARFLGKVFLCSDKESVLEMSRRRRDHIFLCLSSQIIAHGNNVIASGSTKVRVGVFARRREIEELETLCRDLQVEADAIGTQREGLLARLEQQERLRTEWKDQLSAIHIESVGHRKERERHQSDLLRAERDVGHLAQETHRLAQARDEFETKIAAWSAEIATVSSGRSTSEIEIAAVRGEMENAVQQFDSVMGSIHELKVDRSATGERINSLEYQIEKNRRDIHQTEQRMLAIESETAANEQELSRMGEETSAVLAEQAEYSAEKNRLVVDISAARAAFQETCTQLSDLRIRKDELQDKKSDILESLQETELKLASEQAELQRIRQLSDERYHREVESISREAKLQSELVPILCSQIELTWDLLMAEEQAPLLKDHVKTLREKLERYGEVNLTAIQEFDEVQKRYDFLMNQKNDLENSIKTLEEAIIKIDESTKIRFEETFHAVNVKFKEIFPILFNGGKAELSLSNPENLLESGVDVMAQPPGKRFQSITLMSGGEKALTAVSLILAIFARKPSPFCLLDEVDAPLDDANVSRFNTVIRKMAEKTQFILITHNKKTMEIAEALYGVTMERAGISKMTSVQLH